MNDIWEIDSLIESFRNDTKNHLWNCFNCNENLVPRVNRIPSRKV